MAGVQRLKNLLPDHSPLIVDYEKAFLSKSDFYMMQLTSFTFLLVSELVPASHLVLLSEKRKPHVSFYSQVSCQ